MKVALTLALLATAGSLLAFTNGEPPPTETTAPPTTGVADPSLTDPAPTVEIGEPFTAVLFEGRGAEFWHWEAVLLERKVERLERRLQKRWAPTVEYSLRLASVAYGVPLSELRAVAWCESRFNPFAQNRSSTASGTFQFLDSTWAGNRFGQAGFSVFDTVANSLGAAYHVSRYGWGAWVCRA